MVICKYLLTFLLVILPYVGKGQESSHTADTPLVRCVDRPFMADAGLEGRHLALWHSHGLYYELGNARWEWQRARMFQTVEDKFSSAYVLQYLLPMLENAGANVMLPRERDVNPYEIIVDNDRHLAVSPYYEHNGQHEWKNGSRVGFAYKKKEYRDFDNPFFDGTFRESHSVADEHLASTISWTPQIPVEREYAVYVSYHTLDKSVSDAHYTVFHKGGKTSFLVNQKMGGGTWIYLGTFLFSKGTQGKVVLSNVSADEGSIVSADAVRFGGGMGNIARGADGSKIYDNTKLKKNNARAVSRNEWQPYVNIPFSVSGYPRYAEGSRYYLQWAGVPHEIYTINNNNNDYMDDFKSRGPWVNYLAGGSRSWPSGKGIGIPIDLSLAVHTDGGTVNGDKMIGTLGIYRVNTDGGRFGDGTSRSANSSLCQGVYNSILKDVRQLVDPQWPGRGCSERDYNEAAVPKVPSMIIELLSHESFGEMRYGLDPRFQFIVARAVYKGILRFLAKRNGFEYVVQPLPVEALRADFDEGNNCVLSWRAVTDSLEPTARADSFIVYRRVGDGGFDNGTLVADTSFTCSIPHGEVVSFKVTALNRGGQSMDSEILSVGLSSQAIQEKRKPMLIINGFDRISAPDDFVAGDDRQAGFLAEQDNGVPDRRLLSYVGKQKEFRRSIPWVDDDSPGFGASYGDEDLFAIAGNSFDYPALHGRSLLKAGCSFVSMSRKAVKDILPQALDSRCSLANKYSAIDLILGKQKQTKFGRSRKTYANTMSEDLSFKTFDKPLQQLLTAFCRAGGNVMVSGSYIATDLWQNPLIKATESDKRFAREILKYQWRTDKAARDGRISYVSSPLNDHTSMNPRGGKIDNSVFSYFNTANSDGYVVESPDAIIPAEASAYPAFRYSENGLCAGICFGGTARDPWRTVVLAFPFESVKEESARDKMMKQIVDYFYGGN